MKSYLLDTFKYNDWANMEVIKAIESVPEKEHALKLMSHIISAQNKWYNRVTKESDDTSFAWFGKEYTIGDIPGEWKKSVNKWISFLENINEEKLDDYFYFTNPASGKQMKLKIKDLLLQLNYHSI
ncbi:MAG: DinB family protein, partial [Bacteroidia bacterium]